MPEYTLHVRQRSIVLRVAEVTITAATLRDAIDEAYIDLPPSSDPRWVSEEIVDLTKVEWAGILILTES